MRADMFIDAFRILVLVAGDSLDTDKIAQRLQVITGLKGAVKHIDFDIIDASKTVIDKRKIG